MAQHTHIRHGAGSVRPYLYGNLDLPDLIRRAFDADELERLPTPGGFHIEARIGDSMVVLEVGSFPAHVKPTPASVYVYVADVDRAYRCALEAGATSLAAPEDKPYQERAAGVKDTFGNIWYISTYTG